MLVVEGEVVFYWDFGYVGEVVGYFFVFVVEDVYVELIVGFEYCVYFVVVVDVEY